MMKIKVYQCAKDKYIEMIVLGKLKYVGETFGVDGLTNGKIYNCVGIEDGMLRVVDDSNEDYIYSVKNPSPLDGSSVGGKWEPIELYDEKLKELLK